MIFNFSHRNKPNKIENFALKLSLDWGKDFPEKLLIKFPKLNLIEIEYYKNLCKEVEDECWKSVDYNVPQINVNQLHESLNLNVFSRFKSINKGYRSQVSILFLEGWDSEIRINQEFNIEK